LQNRNLFERLEASGKLPTPPAVVLRLLDLTRQNDVKIDVIADTIAMDPALVAEVLRFVNSPMAGVSRKVMSLSQAVSLMGIRGVKMMALSFSVLGNRNGISCAGFDYDTYIVHAVACGVASKVLAAKTSLAPAQEAFVAGLLSQIGRVALASALPDDYGKVLSLAKNPPLDLPEHERAVMGETYASIGGAVLRRWNVPEPLCDAISVFRDDGKAEGVPLARILLAAEAAAAAICATPGESVPLDPAVYTGRAERYLKIAATEALGMLQEIAAEVSAARAVFDVPATRLRKLDDIESEVRERMTELSLALYMENQTMAQQQEELLKRATTDPLTGIGNRAAFDSRLDLELERCAREQCPISLLMIDVDHFKKCNDNHGHQAGDRVLQFVARALDQNVRKVDFVARYGGEEFAVIAPSTAESGVALLAERLRQAIESTEIPCEGKSIRVTISAGVATIENVRSAKEAVSRVIRLADEQLYTAKREGRNRVRCTTERTAQAGPPKPVAAGAGRR